MSRRFTPAERNIVGEQELLAAVHAMKVSRFYLEGRECILITDHNPNTFLRSVPVLSRHMTLAGLNTGKDSTMTGNTVLEE